ncbi:gliding motility-associated C-terminal domain-containing protein [Hymenobacter sp. J193]|uniref:gliding motility-associated C-terminal domain-containing protein n=1 Tax=Hymenobacter sp. J193 TaxID=2898429 RepID=UPI002151C46A|nr:gliding motility-associated C-terminal domain-containing protein [Hymenobacter sp. J193]MCR5890311.1 gliding motility-associated C-terminal domain-containing protein [Hymenobacter sp. J193]MCR5890469.1 gliding motility-associated C-terminal domain-containing protein [Hymenobacter sp. J193]
MLQFALLGTDADQDTVSLAMQGQGFRPQDVGAQLSQNRAAGENRGTFRWVVPCPSASNLLYEFTFTAASTACDRAQTASLTIPIRIDLSNKPPEITANAGTTPLRAQPGELVSFDLRATDPNNDLLSLSMAGIGFTATSVAAELTQTTTGNVQQGHFTWRVPCPQEGKSLYEFEFTAKDAPCGEPKTSILRVAIQIVNPNSAPQLTSSLFAGSTTPLPLQQLPGSVLEAKIEGTDVDKNALVLTARGVGFELAAAGMSFEPHNGQGRATGIFRWNASCTVTAPHGYEVLFELQETTCNPQPQRRTVRFEVQNPEAIAFTPPNIFTPNNDGLNDAFELPDLPPDYCTQRFAGIKVFNRWGKQVYNSTQRDFRWDGSGLPGGVYFYLIEYSNQRQYKGYITIAY